MDQVCEVWKVGTEVVDTEGGVKEVEEEVGREVTELPVASLGKNCREGAGEKTRDSMAETEDPGSVRVGSSVISRTESSREEASAAFLFKRLIVGGRDGVPLHGCCLWHFVWKVCLQAKHFTGFAGLRRGFWQTGQ